MSDQALWLRKTAHQLVAQWTARKAPSRWCQDEGQRRRLIIDLCLELVFAIALRVPDEQISKELLAIHHRAGERGR